MIIIKMHLAIVLIIILVIVILVYYFYLVNESKDTNNVMTELFEDVQTGSNISITTPTKSIIEDVPNIKEPYIYSESYNLAKLSPKLRMNLSIDPLSRGTDRMLVPIHLITTMDNKYLAVFNDGNLYTKNNLIDDTLWVGPLNNSLYGDSQNGIGMRMVMLFPLNKNQERQVRLLGIGTDNMLYYKEDEKITSKWKKSPNTDNLIYLFCDYQEKDVRYPLLYGININGNIVCKIEDNMQPNESIDENDFLKIKFTSPSPTIYSNAKMLKVYWDRNGFMIGIGQDFRLYQKKGIDWKVRPWEINEEIRGKNTGANTKVIDMLMDKDAQMVGLVLEDDMIKIKKQNQPYYLADFDSLQNIVDTKTVYTQYQMIKYKTGGDWDSYFNFEDLDEHLYRTNNLQALYQRSVLKNKQKLKKICKERNSVSVTNTDARNFDLERSLIEKNNKIDILNKELSGLLNLVK
jgi:hypothetical protein